MLKDTWCGDGRAFEGVFGCRVGRCNEWWRRLAVFARANASTAGKCRGAIKKVRVRTAAGPFLQRPRLMRALRAEGIRKVVREAFRKVFGKLLVAEDLKQFCRKLSRGNGG